jgi:homoserine dehydrogenase
VNSVDVPVALLGYGTVGAAVSRLLEDNADDIERATGHRLRVVRALVRDLEKERDFTAAAGVLTTRFEDVLEDDSIAVVAEVMGGLEPTGEYVLSLLRSGKPVVSANK